MLRKGAYSGFETLNQLQIAESPRAHFKFLNECAPGSLQSIQISLATAQMRSHCRPKPRRPQSFRDQYNRWKANQRQSTRSSSGSSSSCSSSGRASDPTLHSAYAKWRKETQDHELEAFEPQALQRARPCRAHHRPMDPSCLSPPPPRLPAPFVYGYSQPPPERTHHKPLEGITKWVDAAFRVVNGKAFPLSMSDEDILQFEFPETESETLEVRTAHVSGMVGVMTWSGVVTKQARAQELGCHAEQFMTSLTVVAPVQRAAMIDEWHAQRWGEFAGEQHDLDHLSDADV